MALLPAIAIQAYNEFELRAARQIELQNQALNLAKLAAAEQQQIVQGIHQVLVALSELPAIKARDTRSSEKLGSVATTMTSWVTFAASSLDLN